MPGRVGCHAPGRRDARARGHERAGRLQRHQQRAHPRRTSARRSSGLRDSGSCCRNALGLKCGTSMRPACCPKRVTASRSASSSVTSRAVQPVVTPSACRAVPAARARRRRGTAARRRSPPGRSDAPPRRPAQGLRPRPRSRVRHVAEPTRRRGHGRLPPWRSGRRGCCTWTSTSSSPRSRCCAVPSWPGCPSSSAAAATPPSAGWSHRVLRGPGVRGRVRDATAHSGPQVPRGGVPARRRTGVRRRVGGRDGHAPVVRGAGRGARLGRGVHGGRDRGPAGLRRRRACRGARRDRAALLGRHRRQQAPRQDRDRLRQAARHVPADRGRPGSR